MKRVAAAAWVLVFVLCGSAAAQTAPARPVLAALGDSITAGVNGGNYVPLLAKALGARAVDLAIAGEFSGPINFQIPGSVHLKYGGVLADEVRNIPTNAAYVTLYIGTNDLWLARIRREPESSDMELQAARTALAYGANLQAIVAAIRVRAPHALLAIADVPNYANRPSEIRQASPRMRTVESWLANAIKASVISTGAAIVDLECDPAMYDDRNYETPYDVHPVASGFQIIASDFARALLQRTFAGSCRYEEPI